MGVLGIISLPNSSRNMPKIMGIWTFSNLSVNNKKGSKDGKTEIWFKLIILFPH
jgi:hypothetical protein